MSVFEGVFVDQTAEFMRCRTGGRLVQGIGIETGEVETRFDGAGHWGRGGRLERGWTPVIADFRD